MFLRFRPPQSDGSGILLAAKILSDKFIFQLVLPDWIILSIFEPAPLMPFSIC
ncbi:putative type II/III secretion system protein [Escherichia coli]|nr:putative type II/III secretion system protein [Escherichia coli]